MYYYNSLHYQLLFVNHKLLFVHTTEDCTGQNHGQYLNCHHLGKKALIVNKNYQQIIIPIVDKIPAVR